MNSKNDSKLTIINHTKNKNKSKLGKQLEQEQNQRNGDYVDGHQRGGGGGRMEEKGVSSINGRYKTDRGKLRIV